MTDGDVDFASAEAWLDEQGIEREEIAVARDRGDPAADAPPAPPHPAGGDGPAPSAREAARLATEAPVQPPGGVEPAGADRPSAAPGRLEDEVAKAVGFIRRSTSASPSSEQRLRDKLAQRDTASVVIDAALRQARRERLVDDEAMAQALAQEWLDKGRAPFRVRRDLQRRGIPSELAERVLERTDDEDPEARAFAVARDAAPKYADVDAETAYRRLVGYLARRGHQQGIARKVAREVVFVEREDERTAGR